METENVAVNKAKSKTVVILCMRAYSPGLWAAAIRRCLQTDERWLQRAAPVESPLPTGQEWRREGGLNEGPQVNTFCSQ